MTEDAVKEAVERKYYPFHDGVKPDAVVVHCSDPRFQEAFGRFVKEEIGVVHAAPIVVPGSVSSVGLELVMPKHLKTLKDQVEMMLSMGKEPRLILINHEECKAYSKLSSLFKKAVHLQQADDLLRAAMLFKKFVTIPLHVSVYMARLDKNQPTEKKVYFEKIM